MVVNFRPSKTWIHVAAGMTLQGRGDADLLALSLNAFFASRICPAPAIRAAMDWAIVQAREGAAVIGGFHSPLERSVMAVLLKARTPLIVVLSRPVATARLPAEWDHALQAGQLTAISHVARTDRLTVDAAARRNDAAAHLARKVFVAHVERGGQLERQVEKWRNGGVQVETVGLS